MPLPKNRIVPEKKIYYRAEIENCPDCGRKLKRHHTAWKKNISTLQGVFKSGIWLTIVRTNPLDIQIATSNPLRLARSA